MTDRTNLVMAADRRLHHVVVLGANGAMGYASAALFAPSVGRVTLLARTVEKAREAVRLAGTRLTDPAIADRLVAGSYDEDLLLALASADLVFEAMAEDGPLKCEMFARIDANRREGCIVATVTSGLSINGLSAGRSEGFRSHFVGLHLFNPPHVIRGTEIIAGRDTRADVVDFIEKFACEALDRVTVRTADTPGFAGNRIGFKVLNDAARLSIDLGPTLVDTIVGPYTGRALAPLRTIDLVGWDVHAAIVDNVAANSCDEAHDTLVMPTSLRVLMSQGILGRKSGRGFFATRDGVRMVLDVASGDYIPAAACQRPDLGYIEEMKRLQIAGQFSESMRCLVQASGEMARITRQVVAGYVAYAFARVGEVCDDIGGIDRIMAFGFNWVPPSALVELLTPEGTRQMLTEAGLQVPSALEAWGDQPCDIATELNLPRLFGVST